MNITRFNENIFNHLAISHNDLENCYFLFHSISNQHIHTTNGTRQSLSINRIIWNSFSIQLNWGIQLRIVLFWRWIKKVTTTTKESSEFQSMPVIATLLNRKLLLVRTNEFRHFIYSFWGKLKCLGEQKFACNVIFEFNLAHVRSSHFVLKFILIEQK